MGLREDVEADRAASRQVNAAADARAVVAAFPVSAPAWLWVIVLPVTLRELTPESVIRTYARKIAVSQDAERQATLPTIPLYSLHKWPGEGPQSA
jgi:hypothetical protein